jgi:stage V sporulation protein SpoVS
METNRIHAVLGALQQLVTCSDNEQIQAISATINQQMQQ